MATKSNQQATRKKTQHLIGAGDHTGMFLESSTECGGMRTE